MSWKSVNRLLFALTLVGMMGPAIGRSDEQHAVDLPADLKVLYAGNPESDRAKDFQTLLSKHFAKVEVTHYGEFDADDANGFDVVIFDWTSTYPRDEDGTINWEKEGGFSAPPAPQLSSDFRRPAILIGAAGGSVAGRLNIAINWK